MNDALVKIDYALADPRRGATAADLWFCYAQNANYYFVHFARDYFQHN